MRNALPYVIFLGKRLFPLGFFHRQVIDYIIIEILRSSNCSLDVYVALFAGGIMAIYHVLFVSCKVHF